MALSLKTCGWLVGEITAITGLKKTTIYDVRIKALSRGQEPGKIIETWYVEDTL